MRKAIFVFCLIFASQARAERDLQKYWREFLGGEKCVAAERLHLFLSQNLGSGAYETHGPESAGAANVILKTKYRKFNAKGYLGGFKVKYEKSVPVKTKDGFDVTYDVVEECK